MIKSLLTVILILLAFTGCTMAPTYTRPTAPIPGEWPTGPAYQATQGLTGPFAPDIGWRSFYTDEKLRNLIDLALKNNRDLRIAALNIEKAPGHLPDSAVLSRSFGERRRRLDGPEATRRPVVYGVAHGVPPVQRGG